MGDDARLSLVIVLLCGAWVERVAGLACDLDICFLAVAQTSADVELITWVVIRAGKAPLQKQVKCFHGKRLRGFVFKALFNIKRNYGGQVRLQLVPCTRHQASS